MVCGTSPPNQYLLGRKANALSLVAEEPQAVDFLLEFFLACCGKGRHVLELLEKPGSDFVDLLVRSLSGENRCDEKLVRCLEDQGTSCSGIMRLWVTYPPLPMKVSWPVS